MFYKQFLARFKPANSNVNYMEVKALSEKMEAAKKAADLAVKAYFAASKSYEAAYTKALAQYQAPRTY